MQDWRMEHLYPTPIYVAKVTPEEGFATIQEEAKKAIEATEFTTKEEWGHPHYLSTTTFTENIIKDQNMNIFSIMLNNHLKNYMDAVGFATRPYKVTSWLSLFQKGNYGQVHNHSWADVSGCYYIEGTPDTGSIFFEDPRHVNDTSYVFAGRYMAGRRNYEPEVGKLIMFPGYLNHGIKANLTDTDRVSLAFNIFFERNLFGT